MSAWRMGCLRVAGVVIASCFGLGVLGAGSALAQEAKFTYTGEREEFKVPAGVTSLKIEAAGAQGGTGLETGNPGGKGARLAATFTVTGGEMLNVLVGGEGGESSALGGPAMGCDAGGGGGSFVDSTATTAGLLVAAAGGGGAGFNGHPGIAGSAAEEAAKGEGEFGGAAGTHGNGGEGSVVESSGAGGGGLLTKGGPGRPVSYATGGKSLAEGGAGGACGFTVTGEGAGGFGGGGGGGKFGGGGGGGYNGGGGGGSGFGGGIVAGGGGGSFSASTPSVAESAVNTGNGLVTFTYTALPTSKEQCKDEGWKTFGSTFKNQGQCLSFAAAAGKTG